MANGIVQHQYENFSIPQRESDGYVDLTQMAKARGKKVNDFLRLKQTGAYLKALSANTGIPVLDLICSDVGGNHSGTWAHPEVAVKFAAWLSAEFEVWAMRTLVKIINGQPARPVLSVPTDEERIQMLSNSFEVLGLTNSPRHLQLVQDRVANLLSPKSLPPAEPQWQGVVEIAEAMGYNRYALSKVRSALGRAVAVWYRAATKTEPTTEKRIVNGRETVLKVYKRTETLEFAIAAYLTEKGIERH